MGNPKSLLPTGQGGEICPPVAKLPPGVKAGGLGRRLSVRRARGGWIQRIPLVDASGAQEGVQLQDR